MTNDRAQRIAERLMAEKRTPKATVSAIARAIRAEVRRAVRPLREAIEACDWSYSRAQRPEVHEKLAEALEWDPMKEDA